MREQAFRDLHLAFVETERKLQNLDKETALASTRFGISFPEYNIAIHELDYQIRVFAPSAKDLEELNLKHHLRRSLDYGRLTEALPVPTTSSHACFTRKQMKSNLDRIARRKAKREGLDFETAKRILADKKNQTTQLPYIFVNSLSGQLKSSKQPRFRLFINKLESSSEKLGTFTTYGLSKNGSTVPIF